MIETTETPAPFGLDFEWPEELWGWKFDDNTFLQTIDRDGSRWKDASMSAKGITAMARHYFGSKTARGHLIEHGFPAIYDVITPNCEGIILYNDNGVEIARRYLR